MSKQFTLPNTLRNLALAGLVYTSGCAHTQQPAAPAPPKPPAAEQPPPIAVDSIQSFMLEHFVISTWARDAIVDGNIEIIRDPLLALADYSYATVAPGGWMEGIAQMQQAARVTALAESLTAAASGIAAMGRTCGQCHREQGGPDVQYYRPEKNGPTSDSLEGRMFRHAWAVERLWEGLTAPSDNAWMAGAAALAQAPAASPQGQPALPPEALEVVRGLGARALRADSFDAREQVYGALLVTCAECHRKPSASE